MLMKGYLTVGLSIMTEMERYNEEWKERILREWDETKKLPRKKKKQRRKELNIDWSIANWSPFQI